MKTRWMWLLTIINLLLVTAGGVSAQEGIGPQAALSTTFTYQGRLTDSGSLANGTYDFQFSLYPTPGGSTAVAGPIPKNNVAVANGLFTVELDFGEVFDGSIRYLQIDVRAGASTGGFTSLSPRQPLRATPYAIYSGNSGSTEALQTHPVSAGPPLSGQVLKWDGTQWAPAADSNTTYTNGPGLLLSGNQFSADTNVVQARVSAPCLSGSSIRVINSDGTVTCEPDNNTTYTNGPGLLLSSNQFSVNTNIIQARVSDFCPTGNSIRAIDANGIVTCEPDNNTTYTNGPGLLLSGNQFSVSFGTTADTAARGDHNHYGASWSGSAPRGLSVQTSSGNGGNAALYGQQGSGTGNTPTFVTGMWGSADGGTGIYGTTSTGYGVRGYSSGTGYAGYFAGKVYIGGPLEKPAGSFKIDHPLDPANKYLYHSFVESPDMKNIYDGIATLDAKGEAVVELPTWFQALNQDFRYQLTCIGGFAQVYIAKEIQSNRFTIAGGKPGLKVSWQVTGIRHDAYANAHRIPIEENKAPKDLGKYLHPEELGQPITKSIDQDQLTPQGDAP